MNLGFKNAMIMHIARSNIEIIIELLKIFPHACNLEDDSKRSFLYHAYEKSRYDIVKIIEEHKYFNKENHHSVVHVVYQKFLQIHDCAREKVPNCTKILKECISDFKKFLENGYNLDFPDRLGHTIIFKIVEIFNSYTIMTIIEKMNLYSLKNIQSLNFDNPTFLNPPILNPATVGIMILKKLIELGHGFPDYMKCSFKRVFCTSYSKNILNYCAEKSVLPTLKMIVLIMKSTKMDSSKYIKILFAAFSTSISLWSDKVQPCTNYRMNTVDYMTSLPLIRKSFSIIFHKHFYGLTSKLKVKNPDDSDSIIELDIEIIRKNFTPESDIAKSFWLKINNILKQIINQVSRMRKDKIHIFYGLIFVYVLKKYSHHLDTLDKKGEKHEVRDEDILLTKFRKEISETYLLVLILLNRQKKKRLFFNVN